MIGGSRKGRVRRWVMGPMLLLAACAAAPASGRAGDALVAKGREIFFKETFGGNGRTCGTCHRMERNFTIDPAFIATLPDDDPLFVAELNPDLADSFENPRLMRELGLILENTNGFGDLATSFTMRGVPHTLALSTSVDGPNGLGKENGWSGDGAPASCPANVQALFPERCDDFDGTLRAFALGAVIQHFPKTLNRVPGVDFRLPTDMELDALEAFQRSLGRQKDLELPLPLKGIAARLGQEIFLDGSLGKCNLCHANAGANADFGSGNQGNQSFDTGVEKLPDRLADVTGEPNPPDDGRGSPGDGKFNTPPLVEAADTGPFFHNNAVATIEGAVAFYSGDAFNNSPAGQLLASFDLHGVAIRLDATQTAAVAAFLRVINALENIRQSLELLEDGSALAYAQAYHEIADAITVLQGGGLHPEEVMDLKQALDIVGQVKGRAAPPGMVKKARDWLELARAGLIE